MSDTLPQSNMPASAPPAGVQPQPTGGMAKETGPHISFVEAPLMQEVGQEAELSSEVSKAGVTIRPESISLPPSVQSLGVKQVGVAGPSVVAPVTSAQLPLSDDQIAQGLHQSIMSSWRWLAEWCTRQLKQTHFILQSIHGKIVRTAD